MKDRTIWKLIVQTNRGVTGYASGFHTLNRRIGGTPIIEEGDEPIAAWEALLLPDWRWEAYDKEDDELYYGRVKSPLTYDRWEYGYFSQDQLRKAGAYRVDTKDGHEEPLFPGGGYDLSRVYETELDAIYDLDQGDERFEDGEED